MVERHVYLHLEPSHRQGAALDEVVTRSEALSSLPGVQRLRVLRAADNQAESAWNLCLVIEFDELSDYERFRIDPVHREYVDQFLKPRTQVIKAWNFRE